MATAKRFRCKHCGARRALKYLVTLKRFWGKEQYECKGSCEYPAGNITAATKKVISKKRPLAAAKKAVLKMLIIFISLSVLDSCKPGRWIGGNAKLFQQRADYKRAHSKKTIPVSPSKKQNKKFIIFNV